MGSPKVRVVEQDDDTMYRTTEVQFGGQSTIRTPGKALDLTKVTSSISVHSAIGGLNEVYKKLAVAGLPKMRNDLDLQRSFSEPIDRSLRKGRTRGDVNVLFLECDEFRMADADRQYLADLVYTHSDVVAVPVVKGLDRLLDGGKRLVEYVKFVKGFVADVEKLNHKTIMGMLSPLPQSQTEVVSRAFLDLGLGAVCVDFDGRSPSSHNQLNMRPLMRRLREEDAAEKTVLYGINVQTGKAGKQMEAGMSPAKDVTAFGFGIDILGQKHMKLNLTSEVAKKMKTQPPTVRFFAKDEYLYRRILVSKVGTIIPKDSVCTARAFADPARRTQALALFNMEQLGLETVRLRQVIGKQSMVKYVKGKKGFEQGDLKHMKNAKSGMIEGGSLDDWG